MVVEKEIFETTGDCSGGGSGEADDPVEAICRRKKKSQFPRATTNGSQLDTQTPRISRLKSEFLNASRTQSRTLGIFEKMRLRVSGIGGFSVSGEHPRDLQRRSLLELRLPRVNEAGREGEGKKEREKRKRREGPAYFGACGWIR